MICLCEQLKVCGTTGDLEVYCPDCGLVHRSAGAPNFGANIRHDGAIPICGWCGFALIVGGPRGCCEQGRAYDSASTYALLPTEPE